MLFRSGYVLQVGDRVFDNSGRHQLDQMMAGKPSLATLKTCIEDYKPAQTSAEGGVVISSANGIVQVECMDKAVYGEIVTFENGAKGMVEMCIRDRGEGEVAYMIPDDMLYNPGHLRNCDLPNHALDGKLPDSLSLIHI